LKLQIAQLEATLKADVGEKGGILDKLSEERGLCAFLNKLCTLCNSTSKSVKRVLRRVLLGIVMTKELIVIQIHYRTERLNMTQISTCHAKNFGN